MQSDLPLYIMEDDCARVTEHLVHIHNSNNNDFVAYTRGYCHLLAIALHEVFGFKIVCAFDDIDTPFWENPDDNDDTLPSVTHVYAVDKNNLAWDISGARRLEDIAIDASELFQTDCTTQIYDQPEDIFHLIQGQRIFDTDEEEERDSQTNDELHNRPLRSLTRAEIEKAKKNPLFEEIRRIQNAG